MKNAKNSFSILFENGLLIAVDKPAGIMVVPDKNTEPAATLSGVVSTIKGIQILPVHQLDHDTTGIVLFAKTGEAQAFLCRQFEKGEVQITYSTLLNNVVRDDNGIIDRPIFVEGKTASSETPKTRFRVIERFRNFTLVEAEPKTAVKNQLSIHFRTIGHPLAVDPENGSRSSLCLSEFKKRYKPAGEEHPLMGRRSLHASSITFTDPITRQPMTVESPLPGDFQITLKQLRKHDKQ